MQLPFSADHLNWPWEPIIPTGEAARRELLEDAPFNQSSHGKDNGNDRNRNH